MKHVIADETGGKPCLDCGSKATKSDTSIVKQHDPCTETKVTIISIRHSIRCPQWRSHD